MLEVSRNGEYIYIDYRTNKDDRMFQRILLTEEQACRLFDDLASKLIFPNREVSK